MLDEVAVNLAIALITVFALTMFADVAFGQLLLADNVWSAPCILQTDGTVCDFYDFLFKVALVGLLRMLLINLNIYSCWHSDLD